MKHLGNHIKAVIFDHDDTLVATIEAKWDQHRMIAKKYYNIDLKDEALALHWGKPLERLVCELYETEEGKTAIEHHKAHHEEFPKRLFDVTLPTLKKLKTAGKKLGVVTATVRYSFEHDLKLHNFPLDLLDYTQTAEETDFHKPDPKVFDPLKEWLQTEGIKPEEVLYIGDGLHDMKAALGAGFEFLGVETGLVTADQFKEAKAQSIPHLGHLLNQNP